MGEYKPLSLALSPLLRRGERESESAAAKTPSEKTSLERQIAATDTQIDRLAYDLYGLTAEEIKIVERAS